MAKRLVVKEKEYKGIVCVFICEEDGTVYLEIKESGLSEKKLVKLNKYLKILENMTA